MESGWPLGVSGRPADPDRNVINDQYVSVYVWVTSRPALSY